MLKNGCAAMTIKCPSCSHEFEPLELTGPQKRGRTMITFSTWIKSLNGADAIPEDHDVWAFAKSVNLPEDFVALAWEKFQKTYADSQKKYKAWDRVFRKAVEENWGKLWYMDEGGIFQLSNNGKVFKRSIGL